MERKTQQIEGRSEFAKREKCLKINRRKVKIFLFLFRDVGFEKLKRFPVSNFAEEFVSIELKVKIFFCREEEMKIFIGKKNKEK